MQIIDGKKLRDEILSTLKVRVAALPFVPVFCDVLVGDDASSAQYVAMKERVARQLGIATHPAVFREGISTEELIEELQIIAAIPNMSGLIIQLPLPAHIDQQAVLDAVPLHIDVDALGAEASEYFYADHPHFVFPTAEAVLAVLGSLDMDLESKHIVMVGRGMLVGRPVAHMLARRGMTVSVVDAQTKHPELIFRQADILISAVGKANLISGGMLKEGVLLIDAGTSESGGAVVGDIDRASVEHVARYLAPVPGGVGPVTVAMLMHNVVLAAERTLATS
jgi:methylenetetrahydrofolate dehydrogenase (NADP+)/methenyltetrahydrofolate cyclohydrolase